MTDLDIAMREMEETKSDIGNLELSDSFRAAYSRIREDLSVSPFLNLTDEMCKWVILAYQRSQPERNVTKQEGSILRNAVMRAGRVVTQPERKPLTAYEINRIYHEHEKQLHLEGWLIPLVRAIEQAHGIKEAS